MESTLIILGATGDLTSRLLLPALGELLRTEPDRSVTLIGASNSDLSDDAWREKVASAFASADASDEFDAIAQTSYENVDITDPRALERMLSSVKGHVALYFAVPPAVAQKSVEALATIALPDQLMLALEKPFGSDLQSARDLNRLLTSFLREDQVFRVDHFLGRSVLLDILGARLANRVFEPLWSAQDVESVEIIYDEALGLEGRAGYYDHSGALVDMIQSHLLQVLALVGMEPPATLGQRDLRDSTAAALRATRVWDGDPVASSRRGRYTAGVIDGRALPSYVDEPGVDPARGTETLAEVRFEVRTSRWQGVPFVLRSGKAVGDPCRDVTLRFRRVTHLAEGLRGDAEGAMLTFSIGENRLSLDINLNGGGDPFLLERSHLVAPLGEGARRAYAEVLAGILDGDPTLSVRGDAAEECWRIVAPVLEAWRAGEVPFTDYPAGTTSTSWRGEPV